MTKMIAILILPLLLLYMKSRVWGEHLSRLRRQSRAAQQNTNPAAGAMI